MIDRGERLVRSLTDEQFDDLCYVIKETEIEQDWVWNGDESVLENDARGTLDNLISYLQATRDRIEANSPRSGEE